MKYIALFILCACPCKLLGADESPYAGEEVRSFKSFSDREVRALRHGGGMGFAKLAELNHYPGPRHVLDMSGELGLSPEQIASTHALFSEMQQKAVLLGEQLLLAEFQLDKDFESGLIDAESLEVALLNLGEIRSKLRFVHLEAHLRQKQLLTVEQVVEYDTIRGYH